MVVRGLLTTQSGRRATTNTRANPREKLRQLEQAVGPHFSKPPERRRHLLKLTTASGWFYSSRSINREQELREGTPPRRNGVALLGFLSPPPDRPGEPKGDRVGYTLGWASERNRVSLPPREVRRSPSGAIKPTSSWIERDQLGQKVSSEEIGGKHACHGKWIERQLLASTLELRDDQRPEISAGHIHVAAAKLLDEDFAQTINVARGVHAPTHFNERRRTCRPARALEIRRL